MNATCPLCGLLVEVVPVDAVPMFDLHMADVDGVIGPCETSLAWLVEDDEIVGAA